MAKAKAKAKQIHKKKTLIPYLLCLFVLHVFFFDLCTLPHLISSHQTCRQQKYTI